MSVGTPGPEIRFGTDGWRGRIADDFTLAGVRRCAAAVAAYLPSTGLFAARVAIGFDGRFLSPRFAREIAAVLADSGHTPHLSPEPIPTPALSRQVAVAADLGVMITASHNPPEYSGVKLKGPYGGTLDPEETRRVERLIPPADPGPPGGGSWPRVDSFLPSYLRALRARVDAREILRSRIRVVADSMHGMGGRLLERALSGGRIAVSTVRAEPDPLFGGTSPEPISPHLGPLVEAVRRRRAAVGIATDGDGDRIGAVDERGRFLSPLTLLPLLAMHVIEVRGERGGIAKTFAGSLRMERIAQRHGLPFFELPVGFKHVAALLRKGEILLGGEESGGFGFRGYLPERDGILSALLILEALAASGRPLSDLVARMEKEYGRYSYDRIDLACPSARGRQIVESLAASPPRRVAGMKVTGIDRLDGLKLLFGEDGWLLIRPSGTEPVLRLYCEAPTGSAVLTALRHAARLTRR